MNATDILVFDVGLGQSIFIYPHSDPSYGMLVDCGNCETCQPVDFLLAKNYLPEKILSNLTLTNYDQDHFSGLPYLRSKVAIRTVDFANNLSTNELKELKEQPHTEALKHTVAIKDTYTTPATFFQPPYTRAIFALQPSDLGSYDTNNLSQVVFVEHLGTVICIPGDLEVAGWKKLLEKHPEMKTLMARTNVFIASHHGRLNGYCPDVFENCNLECIIISDKEMMHDTQQSMSSVYGGHVASAGIILDGDSTCRRRVLSTRNDGHLWIRLEPNGSRTYRTFSV